MFKIQCIILLATVASIGSSAGCAGGKAGPKPRVEAEEGANAHEAEDAEAKALAESIPPAALGQDPGLVEGVDEADLAGGNLQCCSDRRCRNVVWTGNSIHNCCANREGKSWSCPSIAGGHCVKCDLINQGECP